MVRFSDLHVVIDTHRAPKSAEEEDRLADALEHLMFDLIDSHAGYAALLPIQAPGRLLSVKMMSAGVEKGTKYGRMHCHFNLSIKHDSKLLLDVNGVNINTIWQEWVNEQLGWDTPCFVSVDLLTTSRAKNYNAKAGRVVEEVVAERAASGEDSEDSESE